MATKKKTATTTETGKPAVKASPVKKTATTKTTTTEVKVKKAPAAAATHKAPARKAAAPKAEVKRAAVRTPEFDENAHRAEIEHEAYLLWQSRGFAHGQAHEDWIRAAGLVRARYAK